MQKSQLLLLINLLFTILSSCSPTDRNNFNGAIQKTKVIQLPFSDTCGKDLGNLEFSNTSSPLYKYLPNACIDSFKLAVAGKIVENNKFIALLLVDTYGDYQMHFIATFNNNGKLINKFPLFKIGCDEDEYYFGKAECTITKDLFVYLKDTCAEYKRDESGNIINGSLTSKSNKNTFKIAENGSIVKVGS
ncbi:MAG: hypothetical protein WCG87_01395 [Bacteroidota bacterium]